MFPRFLSLAPIVFLAMLPRGGNADDNCYIKYSTITGYFLQDDDRTDPVSFQYNTTNFGLKNITYDTDAEFDPNHEKTQWERFEANVENLNCKAPESTHYKVLYMGRHGEGLHNVAEAFYGTPAWDCYWSEQDGNSTITWADAHLTDNGIAQALVANDFWKTEISEQKIPVPQRYYTSPLDRCLATANLTFSGLDLPPDQPFVPEVKELLREVIGIHTCDRRSNKTWIHENFPTYTFEQGFTEDDELWTATERETDPALDSRVEHLLDDVFSHDDSTFISFTSHSGAIGGILRVIGHRDFGLNTGAVIPVLVKAETIDGTPPSTSINPTATPAPTCTSDPTPSPTMS